MNKKVPQLSHSITVRVSFNINKKCVNFSSRIFIISHLHIIFFHKPHCPLISHIFKFLTRIYVVNEVLQYFYTSSIRNCLFYTIIKMYRKSITHNRTHRFIHNVLICAMLSNFKWCTRGRPRVRHLKVQIVAKKAVPVATALSSKPYLLFHNLIFFFCHCSCSISTLI